MTVQKLIQMLETLDLTASVHIDDEGYPMVNGVYSSLGDEFEGDPTDAPPPNSVLIKILTDVDI